MNSVTDDKAQGSAVVDQKCLHELGRLEVCLNSGEKIFFAEMFDFFELFTKNFDFASVTENKHIEPHLIQLYTRVCMLFTSWLAYEDYELDFDSLYKLSLRQSGFYSLFCASGFRGTAHLTNYAASLNQDGTINIGGPQLVYLLAMMPLDELTEQLFEGAMRLDDKSRTLITLGWLQTKNVFTSSGEKYRSQLFENIEVLTRVTPNYTMLISFINSWMHCSYAASTRKHELKFFLNKMIRNYLSSEGIVPACNEYKLVIKPKMLILHERFTTNHAMYRCYSLLIKSLRPHFELISMGEKDKVDDEFPGLFDQHIVLDETSNTKALVDMIGGIRPDVIYYPSLGMSHWTICLANLKLAPVQIASPGHPATTRSDVIDYMFVGDMPKELYHTHSERLLLIKNQGLFTAAHRELPQVKFIKEKWDGDFFHIAVNASIMKLNGNVIEMCRVIERSSSRPVKFHFFPAVTGLEYDSVKNRLAKLLSSFEIYLPVTYPDLLTMLQKCHLSMSPFPFGNANSLCDALIAGLPVVALRGGDVAGLTDEITLRQFGLENDFVCDTLGDYNDRIHLLINDEEYYSNAVKKIKAAKVYETILSTLDEAANPSVNDYANKFGRLMRFTYDYHQQIQSGNAKAIIYEEICNARLFSESMNNDVVK
ncbi:MAG: hypothetical protein KJ556_15950 [Gammaproteobacteria bacterium]|nr:hypothetical protein [Gammaproteobacteria bacterium]MBU2058338.1 hypothetical protein [Gammaproteobacteria bacterium]MBU2176609.1 hypothetical protein [Gammaproteobacteria bacterium]MBU2248449.1 hypothetical protein [Gammaproteobacteria bacterium]MBU2345688.1 hypothetical protein [Gammaproteobacteria bacterium]